VPAAAHLDDRLVFDRRSSDAPGRLESFGDQPEEAGGVTRVDDIKLYFFHHHHYLDIPEDRDRYHSTMVDYPNSLYDPEKGHALYQRHLRTMRLAEQLGFDGLAINEHHSMAYSMTPTCSLMGAALVTATSRVKILEAGVPINLMYPNRVAEEYAMLDVMSGGRMEFAFPLGTGMEYWANEGTVNPTTSRARFRESLDVILRAWTEDGPIRYEGDFYNYRFLNPWPKPLQKPTPKCFIVGSGSQETVQLAVDYDMGYSIVFVPIANQLRAFEKMRELAAERGRTVAPDELIINVIAYVADSDEEAVREARPHIETFFSWFHRVPPKYLVPPGYVTTAEFLRRASDAAMADSTHASWDDMVAIGRIACGSPATVADTIVHWCQEAGCSRVNVILENGDMPEWKTIKNMTLFAGDVMPRIRARGIAADERVERARAAAR
jgi:alkanesulfonate monooxygenase SsuD/methylene tetrahydromethanopterin reductase-like flavin-dependent oxidoreductase (luciferase family)